MPAVITPIRQKTRVSHLLVGLSGGVLASCASAPEPEPVVYAPPPQQTVRYQPAPKPAPIVVKELNIPMRSVDVRLSESLVRAAGSHAGLMRRVTRAGVLPIRTAEDLNLMMDDLTVVFAPTLGAGLTSYGAFVAAQNSQYVDSVLDKAQTEGIDRVIYQLYASPDYASEFSGAWSAAADVSSAWNDDIRVISDAGARLKQQSYDLQKEAGWVKKRVDNRKDRIAALKTSQNVLSTVDSQTQRDIAATGAINSRDVTGPARRDAFWRAYGKTSAPQNYGGSSAMSLNVKKALTLAALETLGATDKRSSAWIANYTTAPTLNQCTNWARLHVEQCLAAGHYKYEDAFCIAEHQLTDTSECLQKSAL